MQGDVVTKNNYLPGDVVLLLGEMSARERNGTLLDRYVKLLWAMLQLSREDYHLRLFLHLSSAPLYLVPYPIPGE